MNGGLDVVAIVAMGMGLVFWLTDRPSPSSRALALFLALLGLAVMANAAVAPHQLSLPMPIWARGIGLLDAATFVAGCEWGMRAARTVSDRVGSITRVHIVRSAQVLAVVYALLVLLFPQLRYHALAVAVRNGTLPEPAFAMFLVPAVVAGALVLAAGLQLLRRRLDHAERIRIVAALAAMPMLAGSLLLPERAAAIMLALGEVMFLYGAVRYYVVQGARANFMAQFLSPQVADLVRLRGLRHAMARKQVDITVVCCDIRRFTGYAQQHSPEQVMRFLRSFYAAVGAAAREYGGTVKDFAGDGALILIGAPVPYPDKADRALKLARRLQQSVRPVVRRHSRSLGLGVGVASGSVAVGIVGEGDRFEYMAVGAAVNLASRLCDKAADGEIHVDQATLDECGAPVPARRRRRYVKGFEGAVTTYVLDA
ncbi:MAG: adenylate/guanylate cyclase domain-containing protein [Nevskiales bacterium]|nr:adenylate/guanylate cyclase domain-containing protein [Nevskiales bacterium]